MGKENGSTCLFLTVFLIPRFIGTRELGCTKQTTKNVVTISSARNSKLIRVLQTCSEYPIISKIIYVITNSPILIRGLLCYISSQNQVAYYLPNMFTAVLYLQWGSLELLTAMTLNSFIKQLFFQHVVFAV